MHAPGSLEDIAALSRFLLEWATEVGIPAHEHALFVERLLTLLTSCDERRLEQWEQQSWWEFSGADRRSAAYGKFLADGLTRTLVAARAREMSARTGGLILLQLLFDLTRAGGRADRVLNAPTQEAWITPWIEHLQRRGVELHAGAAVARHRVRRRRIAGVTVGRSGGAVERVSADFYVAALPVEQLRLLVTPELRRAEPALARLDRLVTRWMNGIMFYLDRDVPLVHGHAIYIDSEWALTSISQAQFWGERDLARVRGRARGGNPLGRHLGMGAARGGVPARSLPSARPRRSAPEVWGQLQDHLNDGPTPVLADPNLLSWFLDPAIEFPNPTGATNLEPLLINTAGSWADRPEARDADRQPVPRLRLRAHAHRPRDDGGRQRGGAAGGQRDPGGERLDARPLRRLEARASRRSSAPHGRSTGCAGGSSAAR